MLKAREIIAEAEDKVGISDPETRLHPALEALAASLNGDNSLSPDGEAAARKGLLARTVDRLDGLKWMRDYPEIAEERIEAPLFLTGLPRSGTTYFQYLFDRDRRFRSIRTWEAMMPSPPPGFDIASVEGRKAREGEIRRQMRAAEVEGFDALHLIDEDGSEECHAFLEQGYGAAGFFNLYDVPGYFDYLMRRVDMADVYRVHRRQLQLLQWRAPERRRWALKYPNHVIAMDAIADIHPEARFAMTHRDPVQVVASIARMTLALRSTRYEMVDPRRVGRQMLDFIRRHVDRIMAFCTGPRSDRAIHVDYYRLVADPMAELHRVHDWLGIGTPPDVEAAITGWRRDNPKNRRGANDYALAQFGIDPDAAAALFADYRRHFHIPTEQEGLAAMGAA
ncbi:MAG: sulfotransferase [Sphingobium sp.]